jgi:hypothetical protein
VSADQKRGKTSAEILREAREIIADPTRWTTQAVARNTAGELVTALSQTAVCWCAQGACMKVANEDHGKAVFALVDLLDDCAREFGYEGDDGEESPSGELNDVGDHSLVMRLFDCAIERAA